MADIAGYSSLVEHADPEAVFHLLNDIFGELVETLIAHGAHIDKYVGDEIIALFGVPMAQEHSIERAVRAALAIQDRLQVLSQDGRFRGQILTLHIGIHVGPVMVGRLGHHARADYTVIGDTVNVAKRLEEMAPSGSIYVSQAVFETTRDLCDYLDIGPTLVKGRQQEIHVYQLRGMQAGLVAMDTGNSNAVAMQDRAEEFATLLRGAERALAGQLSCICLTGPAGIGKTRLIQEWRQSSRNRRFRTLSLHGHPYDEHYPGLPVVSLLARMLGLRIEGWPPRVNGDLAKALGVIDLLPADRETLRLYLQHMSAADIPGGYDAVCGSLITLLHALLKHTPICLILEDIQWLDETSRHVLPLVFSALQSRQLFVLMSAREPGQHWAVEHLTADLIPLSPLSSMQISELITQWAAPATLPTEVIRQICERAQGHPYFAHELTNALRHTRVDALEHAGLPHTLQELFLSQLDMLPLHMRRLVQAASVVGEPVIFPLIEAAIPQEIKLTPALVEEAFRLGLFRMGTTSGLMLFDRRLLFETAYSTIPPSHRQQLHARIAERLIEQLDSLGESAVPAAAYHAYQGFHDARALALLLRSAQQYRSEYANRQVIITANRMIEIISSLEDRDQYLLMRLEALLLTAQSYQVLGDLGHAEGTLGEAELLAEACEDRDLVARIALSTATLALMRNDAARARQEYQRAVDLWTVLGNTTRGAHAMLGMGMCALAEGDRDAAFSLFTGAADLGSDTLWIRAAALNNAGMLLMSEGRYREAVPYLTDGLHANETDGDRRGIAFSKASLGEAAFRLGRLDEAATWLRACIEDANAIEDMQCRSQSTILLARVLCHQGIPGEARGCIATVPDGDMSIEISSQYHVAALELLLAEGIPDDDTRLQALLCSACTDSHDVQCLNAHLEAYCIVLAAYLRWRGPDAASQWIAATRSACKRATDTVFLTQAETLITQVETGAALSDGVSQ